MKRRDFVKICGILGAGVMTLPLLHCHSNDQYNELFHQPRFLSQICDDKVLREIGLTYVKLKPSENKGNRLLNLLRVEAGGKKISSNAPDNEVETFLNNKIHNDFEKNDIITVRGWILSLTEARQCALFSYTPL